MPGPGRGRGFTEKEVLIGYGVVRDDSGAAISALGIQGVGDPGDTEAQFKAVVDEANRRGGLGGRKIVPVPYYYDINEVLFDPNTAAQKSCTHWTQDKQVFAVVLAAVTTDNFLQCLKNHSTPFVHSGGVDYPRSYQYRYEKFPLYFNVGGMLAERFDSLSVERLVARKYFSGWDTAAGSPGTAPMRLGVIVFDTPEGTAHVKSLTAALARFGLRPTTVFRTSDGLADRTSEQQAAVLRFRSDGITHVMWAGLTFIRTAEGQNYRPRYFVPVLPLIIAESAPPEQMNGAMGEGFIPAQDVTAADYPGDPSAASTSCLKVMKQTGQTPTNPTMLWAMQLVCDAVFPLQAAVGASQAMSPLGVRTGFEALGSQVASAVTWTSVFGPGEHSSARALRDLAYHRDCTCFRYTSEHNHLG